jgi:trigger factor
LGDYKDIQEFKDKFKESMLERKKQKSEGDIREKIFDILIEKNSFDVPKKMVETQAKNMIMEMQQMFASQGMNLGDMGQSPEQLIENYKQPAEKQVRSALILEAIAKKENLDADKNEIEEKYEEIARQVGKDVSFVKEKVTDDMIKPQVLEKKALDLIISKATLTEK